MTAPEGAPRPQPDLETAETFPIRMTFLGFYRRFVFYTVMTVVLMGLLFTWLLVLALPPGRAFAAGAGIGVVCGALVVVLCLYLYRHEWAAATLELSPDGLRETTGSSTAALRWADVRELENVALLAPAADPLPFKPSAPGAYGLALIVRAGVRTTRIADQQALAGWGEMALLGTPGKAARTAYERVQADRPRDKKGRPRVRVGLSRYDPGWRAGRIGAWVRAYRPDLLRRGRR